MAIETVPIPFPASLDAKAYEGFGREVRGVGVANFTENEFMVLEKLLYEHDLLLFRDCNLTPQQQCALTKAFDPTSNHYGHGNNHLSKSPTSLLTSLLTTLPSVPQVQLIGNGTISNHEGISSITLKHPSHKTFHAPPHLTSDQESRGETRFYRWHMDAALYEFAPPKVTSLYSVRTPLAPRQKCRYADDYYNSSSTTTTTEDVLENVSLGATAFVSGKVMFEILPVQLKSLAVRTKVRYAPHPFVWMKGAKAVGTGLGLVTEGREVPLEMLPEWEEGKVQELPMVWKNEVTGNLHLQAHPCAAMQLIIDPVLDAEKKDGALYPDGARIEDLKEVRDLLYKIQRPAIAPKFIYPHDWKEKDLVIFHNRGLLHTALGTFKEDQVRVFHQCNLAGSDFPRGPSHEDVARWS
ncbi:hypothetical protein BXZ70DRAFT_992019 [Cristinia sonorae]|uniref:TauD/TfdA-like domain-containing protein n=1 Tax=Cristinia sonorae TaxID=1940300 RepID=A0A8K0XN19_9AGAR|nr:hypothetical protein BXZ70DRAFT_992019 [Cristinia sonorae]